MASGNGDGTVALWAAKPQTAPRRQSFQGERLGFSADGKVLAVLGTNSMVEYHDLLSGTLVSQIKLPGDISGRVRVIASPDVRFIVGVETNGVARVWEAPSQKTAQFDLKRALRWPSAVLSPDNRFVAVSTESLLDGGEGWVGVWDLERGQLRELLTRIATGHRFRQMGGFWRPGSTTMCSFGVFPISGRSGHFPGTNQPVKTLAFSRDNAVLGSTGREETAIRLWEVASGRFLRSIATSA